jgi:plasmid replication initiation protein
LKQKIIEGPIKEINEAGIGLEITPTTIKQGNRIVSIRFYCKQTARPARGKKKNKVEAEITAMLPQSDLEAEQEREDKELAHLREFLTFHTAHNQPGSKILLQEGIDQQNRNRAQE